MANLYTKTGDKGETSLYGGKRVKKNSLKVECYGTMDEANSMLGLAYSQINNEKIKNYINEIQKKIFVVGAELASDDKGLDMLQEKVSKLDISYLETIIDECSEITGKQTEFVVPGKNQASASLHVARTIIRRAERNIISLKEVDDVREELIKYVNRLSDTIYALARLEETNLDIEIIRNKVIEKLNNKFSKVEFTLDNIKLMAEYAQQKAKEMNVPIVFSAVDSGGNLVLLHRMENSLLASIDISINKAYTANSVKMPTHELKDLAQPNKDLYGIQNTNKNKIVIFGGGLPFKYDGNIVGAIGVSGGSVEEDTEIAIYSMEKLLTGGIKDGY